MILFYLRTDRNVRFIIPIRHNFLLLCSIKSNWRERSLKDFRQMLSKMIPRDKCLQILLSFVTSRRVSFVFMTKSSKFKKSSSSQLQYRDLLSFVTFDKMEMYMCKKVHTGLNCCICLIRSKYFEIENFKGLWYSSYYNSV